MKTTRYFDEQVLRKRPYIKAQWCQRVIDQPLKRLVQEDKRVRYWGAIEEADGRILRVVTLDDGKTIHNAFFDRGFKQEP